MTEERRTDARCMGATRFSSGGKSAGGSPFKSSDVGICKSNSGALGGTTRA